VCSAHDDVDNDRLVLEDSVRFGSSRLRPSGGRARGSPRSSGTYEWLASSVLSLSMECRDGFPMLSLCVLCGGVEVADYETGRRSLPFIGAGPVAVGSVRIGSTA